MVHGIFSPIGIVIYEGRDMMGYRISYAKKRLDLWSWWTAMACLGGLMYCAAGMEPVWKAVSAGEGLYDALARFVGGMSLGAH